MSSDHLTILKRLRDEEAGWDNPEFVAALDAGIAALTRESAAHGTPTTCGDTCDCGYENKLNGQCSCGYVHEQPSTPDPVTKEKQS